MTDITPIYSFPFPELTDAPDGPSQFEDLALAVETVIAALTAVVNGKQPLDADLTALAALASTGLVARTGAGTYAERTLTSTGSTLTITDGGGVAGNPNLELAETAVVTAGFTANAGWSNAAARYQIFGGNMVFLSFQATRDGGTITSGASGDITNSAVFDVIPVAIRPVGTRPVICQIDTSHMGVAQVTNAGTVTLVAVSPDNNIVNGDVLIGQIAYALD